MKTPKPYPTVSDDWIKARVRENEFGCWVWAGYMDGNQPKTNLGPKSDRRPLTVRRLVWASAGRELRPGYDIACKCGTHGCVRLRCLVKRKHGATMTGVKRDAATIAKVMKARRARSKISDAAVERIRESAEPTRIVAEREGCSAAYVHMLRRGEFRRPLDNPFAGLMR